MQPVVISVNGQSVEFLQEFGLFVGVRETWDRESSVVVGAPGQDNVIKRMYTNDALLYQTSTGTFEVRVLKQDAASVSLVISRITPRLVLAGDVEASDIGNEPFTPAEAGRISRDLEKIKQRLLANSSISEDQHEVLVDAMDRIDSAMNRLGRKDWLLYALGTFTSIGVGAAFSDAASKAIFAEWNSALSWITTGPMLLLN